MAIRCFLLIMTPIEHLFREISERLDHIEQLTKLAAKNVLTLDDVVLLTGLSKNHLYNLTSRNEIPYYRPRGKFIYFDRAEVEAWMKQNRVNTREEAKSQAAAYCSSTANTYKIQKWR